jgi:hypothetical protein
MQCQTQNTGSPVTNEQIKDVNNNHGNSHKTKHPASGDQGTQTGSNKPKHHSKDRQNPQNYNKSQTQRPRMTGRKNVTTSTNYDGNQRVSGRATPTNRQNFNNNQQTDFTRNNAQHNQKDLNMMPLPQQQGNYNGMPADNDLNRGRGNQQIY